MKLNLNFQGKGGSYKKNPFHGGGMDILWNYTFKISAISQQQNHRWFTRAILKLQLRDVSKIASNCATKMAFGNRALWSFKCYFNLKITLLREIKVMQKISVTNITSVENWVTHMWTVKKEMNDFCGQLTTSNSHLSMNSLHAFGHCENCFLVCCTWHETGVVHVLHFFSFHLVGKSGPKPHVANTRWASDHTTIDIYSRFWDCSSLYLA